MRLVIAIFAEDYAARPSACDGHRSGAGAREGVNTAIAASAAKMQNGVRGASASAALQAYAAEERAAV